MARARVRAEALAVIAEIRGLQSRAAELEAARAAGERRAAEESCAECRERLAGTEAGWTATIEEGALDPELARHWFAALEAGRAEQHRLDEEAAAAEDALVRSRAAWQAASARTDAAREQSGIAARRAGRRREEARLAAVEDRAAAAPRQA
ncbi:MAG TPA: hypothetical protein VGW40_14975 [Allosphingosinicella sp.]|nr:hypothetical protein [Allosphingosinicella sp.]